jgi:stage II sporulation protein GA (sporulation sigma-E factor processing peptidase)
MISGEWTLSVSFLFDALIMWITARFMFVRVPSKRLFGAVLVGQGPTLWVLLIDQGYAGRWQVVFLAWPLVMLYIVFGRMSRREWIRATTVFYATTVLAAGLVLGLASAERASQTGWALWQAAAVLGVLGWRGPAWWRQSGRDQLAISDLEIDLGGVRVSLKVLWDSGNLLRDPVLRRPVIVVELAVLWAMLPEEVLAWCVALLDGRLEPIPSSWTGRLGVVQFSSIGGSGMIPVIRPETVRAWQPGRGFVTLMPTMLGLVARPVSETGRYQALASPDCQPEAQREGVVGA